MNVASAALRDSDRGRVAEFAAAGECLVAFTLAMTRPDAAGMALSAPAPGPVDKGT